MKCVESNHVLMAYANRNNLQEQPRVRTREGRPVWDICGRVVYARQNCYARVDQRNQYQNPQNTQPRPQSGPRSRRYRSKKPKVPQNKLLPNLSTKSRRILPNQLVEQTLKAPTTSTTPLLLLRKVNMMLSCEDLVSVTNSAENDTTGNVIQDSSVQETAMTATKEPLASNSQTREPPVEEPSSTDNSY